MRRYETIFILDPDLSDEGRAPVIERLVQLIPQQGGMLVEEDHWGVRKLAYAIRKKPRGYYLRLDYCGSGTLVDELERFCRIDERVLKYMTVQLAIDVDLDQIQTEMAERAAAKTAADAATAEAPATTATESVASATIEDATATPSEPAPSGAAEDVSEAPSDPVPATATDDSAENPARAENENEDKE
jgi:small subunit ribosomal protein S6